MMVLHFQIVHSILRGFYNRPNVLVYGFINTLFLAFTFCKPRSESAAGKFVIFCS